jgi:hypothetical protein
MLFAPAADDDDDAAVASLTNGVDSENIPPRRPEEGALLLALWRRWIAP